MGFDIKMNLNIYHSFLLQILNNSNILFLINIEKEIEPQKDYILLLINLFENVLEKCQFLQNFAYFFISSITHSIPNCSPSYVFAEDATIDHYLSFILVNVNES